MEVSCINKNAVNHKTNRSFIKAQQVCFSSAVENPFSHIPILYQHITNLQGDIGDLLAKSAHFVTSQVFHTTLHSRF